MKDVLPLTKKFKIKGIAHITGGAYYEKLTKILPKGKCFRVKKNSWPVPMIFDLIRKKGRITDHEMYRTFNMGIGLVLVVSSAEIKRMKDLLQKGKIRYYLIGEVINHPTTRILL